MCHPEHHRPGLQAADTNARRRTATKNPDAVTQSDRPIEPTQPRPSVDLSEQIRAAAAIADRSRSAGAWSLGHLRLCLPALAAGELVLGTVGAIVEGWGAVLGVLIGTVIVGGFFSFSAVVIAWVGKTNPSTVMIAALFAYVIKIFVLAVILMTMPIDGPVNVRWMAGAIGLGVFLWLAAHMRYVWTLKLYYVDPG
jgi:ATP synthase protein I